MSEFLPWMATLGVAPAADQLDLVAAPVAEALRAGAVPDGAEVWSAAIDPGLADTAAFCEAYGVPAAASANCVVLGGKREGVPVIAAAVILATTRADVNGVARRLLNVRKLSFLSMDEAVGLTGMEYGGITPIGLPAGWRLLVDSAVTSAGPVVIGSGLRSSKIVLPGSALAGLPGAEVVEGLAR